MNIRTDRFPDARRRRRERGLTLIESLITLAVTALLLGSAVPSFESARARRHLDGAAAQLETDIHFARSMAVMQNQTIRIDFSGTATASCYVVHHGSAGACQCRSDGTAACTSGTQPLRSVRFGADGPLRLTSNVASIVFDPAKGTSTPTGTLRLDAGNRREVHLVVNLMGRVRTCSPAPGVAGYRPC